MNAVNLEDPGANLLSLRRNFAAKTGEEKTKKTETEFE
jgi:hypothetical protein